MRRRGLEHGKSEGQEASMHKKKKKEASMQKTQFHGTFQAICSRLELTWAEQQRHLWSGAQAMHSTENC